MSRRASLCAPVFNLATQYYQLFDWLAARDITAWAVASGVWDLCHRGHLYLLQQAADAAYGLIVLVNSDESTRRLKGPDRPVVPLAWRAYCLSRVRGVDCVVTFEEDTPRIALELIRPAVLVRGAASDVVTVDDHLAEEVLQVARRPLISTTAIIKKIRTGGDSAE